MSPTKWFACPSCASVITIGAPRKTFMFCGRCEQEVIPVEMDQPKLAEWVDSHPGFRYDEAEFARADMEAENYFKPVWAQG